MREILTMTAYEWKTIRSKRWLLLFTIFYSIICVSIAFFGSVYTGIGNIQDLRATGISLLNFSLLFIPLMALLTGVTSFTDQQDSWELLCTQPLTVSELIAGKYLGQFAGIIFPILIGYGLAGIVIGMTESLFGWQNFLFLIGLTILTAAIFLALSFIVTALCKRTGKVYGWIFAIWAVLLLLYEMLIIGIVVLSAGTVQKLALWFALILNPVDMIRILGVSQMGSYDEISATGTLVQTMLQNNGSIVLFLAVFIWFMVFLLGSIFVTKRQDLV